MNWQSIDTASKEHAKDVLVWPDGDDKNVDYSIIQKSNKPYGWAKGKDYSKQAKGYRVVTPRPRDEKGNPLKEQKNVG